MQRAIILLVVSILVCGTACHKSSNDAIPPDAVKIVFNINFSIDSSIGSITQKGSSDTFIVDLRKQVNLDSVPVTIHVDTSYQCSLGKKINDSTYMGALDISNNSVVSVKITSPEDSSKTYSIGFKYIITTYTSANGIANDFINGLFVKGDSIYVSTDAGLSISRNGGITFRNYTETDGLSMAYHQLCSFVTDTRIIAGGNLGIDVSKDNGKSFNLVYSSASPYKQIRSLYAKDNMVYAATNADGIAVSSDSGATFVTHSVSSTTYANIINKIAVKDNKLYVATRVGLYISIDKGVSYTYTGINDLPPTEINSVYVDGNNIIYVALNLVDGVFASYDGGKTFVSLHSPSKTSSTIYAEGDNIYLCYFEGLYVSTDKGRHFNQYTLDKFTVDLFVQGHDIYTASTAGITVLKAR